MKHTKHYKFKKPEPQDTVNIEDFNQSFDLVDEVIKRTEDENRSIRNEINQLVVRGDSSVEAAQARVSKDGTVHPTLKGRLDTDNEIVMTQLRHKATKVDTIINILDYEYLVEGNDWTPAISHATTLISQGGILYFPKGTYVMAHQFPYVTGMTIKGDGYSQSIIRYIGKANISAFIDVTSSGFSLEDIRISGNTPTDPTQSCHGVHLRTISGQTGGHYLKNVYISHFGGHGLYVDPKVYMCFFDSIRLYYNSKTGLYINGTDSTYSNIHAEGNSEHGIAMIAGNNRLLNFNCIYNGAKGIDYSGYYQASWNCQLSNGQCQDNYYNGYIFDGARSTTLAGITSDASGRKYGNGVETSLSSYEFVFKNSCYGINGNIEAVNYLEKISAISGLFIDSSCEEINLKYAQWKEYFANSPIILSGLVKIDTTSQYLFDRYIHCGKTLRNIMKNASLSTINDIDVIGGTKTVEGNILSVVFNNYTTRRVKLNDNKSNNKLMYVGLWVRAKLGDSYVGSIFKDNSVSPSFHAIGRQEKKGNGDWQYISWTYYLKNDVSIDYYPWIGGNYEGQEIEIKNILSIDLTTDLEIAFSRNSTEIVYMKDFVDKLIKEIGWFQTSYTLT